MKKLISVIQIAFPLFLTAPLLVQPASGQVNLQLVSARDHIEGSFTTSQSVYADRNYVYLASWQGRLFILARSRSSNFPLVETIQVSSAPLTAVRGDGAYVYVSSADGALHVYQSKKPFLLVNSVPLSEVGLRSLALILPSTKGPRPSSEKLYVSEGQAALEAFGDRLYLSKLNDGETGLELAAQTFSVGLGYGQTSEANATVVFDRLTGQRITAIPNPTDLYGSPSQVSIYADTDMLAQTTPGCCGQGIVIRDQASLAVRQFISRWSTNTVTRRGQWLIAGNEGGQVEIYDVSKNPAPLASAANLRQLTGHTGAEDIEIRALWTDTSDGLIFAASSWGNDASRNPFLPSFFVLELATGNKR